VHYAAVVENYLRKGSFSDTISLFATPNKQASGSVSEPTTLLLTNVSWEKRERRRLVQLNEIPKVLVDAVVLVEDKRFFHHGGFDPLRLVKAAYVDLKTGRKEEGASTLTMQLARSVWLSPDKSWRRKAAEFFMALELEQRLSKQQILEYYCNEIYLGHRGTYDIHGFGEASPVYFDKPVQQLSLAEAATLAGMIQRPGYYDPFRYPERVRGRRNRVLAVMQRAGRITEQEYTDATAEPLTLSAGSADPNDASYFVDLVRDELQKDSVNVRQGSESYEVYTTLDPQLQRAALDAVRYGMPLVDKQLRGRGGEPPQVALVALDPRTGSIKALVGGRDYNSSQLNRALAKRQPGSAFKPFVYAAALRTAEYAGAASITAATMLDDTPTTFWFNQKAYAPRNFHHQFYGEVTLRSALAKSMNLATIHLAERVGYNLVADMAHRAGLDGVRATPSAAIGAYESTPIDMAAAYAVFANQGLYVKPHLVSAVRGQSGDVIYSHPPVTRQALSPQVNYLMVSLLQEVLTSGTGAAVRGRGVVVQAGGKTGTSRDGWFAGFTSDLVCVVWVGYDDNRDLKLEGSKSALPIWAHFMKNAVKIMGAPKPFRVPSGILRVEIDAATGLRATPHCMMVRSEVFISGTEPIETCTHEVVLPAIPAT